MITNKTLYNVLKYKEGKRNLLNGLNHNFKNYLVGNLSTLGASGETIREMVSIEYNNQKEILNLLLKQ